MHQRRILVCGTVVRHLQDVDPGQLRMCRQQRLLRRRFEITEKQERQSAGPYEQGHAGVVGPVERRGERHDRRPEHFPAERAEPPPLPGNGAHERDPGPGGRLPYELGLTRRILEGRGLDRADRPATEHAGKSVHVVGMDVFFALRMSHEASG